MQAKRGQLLKGKEMNAAMQALVRMLIFAVSLQFAMPCNAQEPQSTPDDTVIRVNVELVQVDVQVQKKKTGSPVGSLSKDDFQLYDDGVNQHIVTMSRDQLPLSVVLLFDLTYSVRAVLDPLAAGAMEALKHLKPEDEVAVMVYAGSAQLLQDFTTNREQVVAAIEKARAMKSGDPARSEEGVFRSEERR